MEDGLLDMVRASTPFVEHGTGVEPMDDIQVVSDTAAPVRPCQTTTASKAAGSTQARRASGKTPSRVDIGMRSVVLSVSA